MVDQASLGTCKASLPYNKMDWTACLQRQLGDQINQINNRETDNLNLTSRKAWASGVPPARSTDHQPIAEMCLSMALKSLTG